jgi:hypothetical protein
MSCLLNRNENGAIVSVSTPQGAPSELFNAIHSNIFLGDAELSAKILSFAYSDSIQKTFENTDQNKYSSGEPMLYYRSKDNTVYSDLEQLIIDNKSGDVQMGFVNPKSGFFIPIAKFSTTSGPLSKFMTSQVLEGVLSTERVLGADGVSRYQGKGEYLDTRIATAVLFRTNAKETLAAGNVSVDKTTGLVEMAVPSDFIMAETKEGDFTPIHITEIDTVASQFENDKELLAISKILSGKYRTKTSKRGNTTLTSTSSIVRSLNSFLQSLGFTQTTLDAYKERYNTLYGKDPDIQALADISNRVVAYANGQITIENLSEEVAHIAIEAYSDQNAISGMLAVAHLTPEYNQYAEYYRQKYAPFFSGIELEDQVRKEVLGKILAKEFVNRFSTENQSPERISLIQKLKDLFETVLTYVTNRIKPYHIRALNDLNRKIADNVINNNMKNFDYDLSSSNKFFYSAMDSEHQKLHRDLLRARKVVEDMVKADGGMNIDRYRLEQIQEAMNELNLVSSANTIIGITDRKVQELDRELKNLKSVNGRPATLSMAGENIASNLRNNLIPLISSIEFSLQELAKSSTVTDADTKAQIKQTVKQLSEDVTRISETFRKLDQLVDQDMETVANMAFQEAYGALPEEVRRAEQAKFVGSAKAAMKDYGFMGRMFGLMTESRNPVLQLIANRVQQMNLAVRMKFTQSSNKAIAEIKRKGYQKYEGNIIKKDAAGKNTHYIWGPIDWAKYDADVSAQKDSILANITGKSVEEIQKLRKQYTVYEILKDNQTDIQTYRNSLTEWSDQQRQKQFLPEYYEQQKQKFEKHKISISTQETLKTFGSRAAEINRNHLTPDGRVNKNTMSEGEIEALNRIKKEKELVKSPYDRANEVRLGLQIVKASELTDQQRAQLSYTVPDTYKGDLVILAEGFALENLTEESRTSLDLNNLTYAYMFDAEKDVRTPSEEFMNTLKDLEQKAANGEITYQEVYNWVDDNSTISLSDEYYQSLDNITTYAQSVENYISTLTDPVERRYLENLLFQHNKLTNLRKYLLKQNKKVGSTLDVNVHGMDNKTRLKLLEIESEITRTRRNINLPEEFKQTTSENTTVELSEDFWKMAVEAGLSEEGDIYTFALRHMTHERKIATEEFAVQLNSLINGDRIAMDGRYEDFLDTLEENGVINDNMTREQLLRVAKDEFAKSNVASYFKKYLPSDFNDMVSQMKTGQIKMSDFLSENPSVFEQNPALANIKITPDYTWTESISSSQLLNPAYKKGEYYLQLNEKYIDKSWFDHYGISLESYRSNPTDNLEQLRATKNVEEFEYLKAYMSIREQVLKNYNDTDRVNKWQRVQIAKSEFEKYSRTNVLLNIGSYTKDSIKEFTQNRIDEKAYGEEVEGINLIQEGSEVSVRAIPKYFQKKLEDPENVTESTLSAVLLDLKESIVYAERTAADRDVRALMHQLTRQNFVGSGVSIKGRAVTKKGEVTGMYQKAKEYVDHHLYGVQQSRPLFVSVGGREIDFTKVITSIQNFARFSNLGFNFFVDATGATTGFLNNVIDRFAGDYYHKSSVNRANSQATAMILPYLKEKEIESSLARTTKLGQILELLGIDDPTERVRESNAGAGRRIAKNLPYLGSRLSNLAISPKVALATLNDMRYFEGRFLTFEDFVHNFVKDNLTNQTVKQAEVLWKTLEKESLFDHLDFTQDGLTYNQKFKDRFGENAATEFTKLAAKASQKAQKIIMNSDMVINDIDRVAAQRDVLTNTLMMHRGWAIIGLTKRFKSSFYNLSTGKYEEGQYVTLYNFLANLLGTVRGKGNIAEVIQNLDRRQKANLTRVGVETAVFIALLILGESVLAGDDDDDTALENLFQLIYLRTTSEFASTTILGIPGAIVEVVDSPIPAINTYKMFNVMKTVPDMFSEDDNGKNKFLKTVRKNSILRRYDQYSDLQTQVDAYRFYNDPTLFNLGSVGEKQKESASGQSGVDSDKIN